MRQRAKSISINLTTEDWQEVVDWVLRKRAETGKNLYSDAAEFFLRRWDLVPEGQCWAASVRKFSDMAEFRVRCAVSFLLRVMGPRPASADPFFQWVAFFPL